MQPFYKDGITIITLSTIVLACLGMTLKLIFKSKCTSLNFCYGLCQIQRAVEFETELNDIIPPNNTTV